MSLPDCPHRPPCPGCPRYGAAGIDAARRALLESLAERAPYREPVGWLRCFRGIDTLTAMTLVAELHDFMRFDSARGLMAYLGLVPSEHSSGERVVRGSITKTGNRRRFCRRKRATEC